MPLSLKPPHVPPGRQVGPDEGERFAAMVRPFLGELVRVARRQLECNDMAWEAVQDALLGLWNRLDSPADPRSWLIRAVLYRSLHLRRTIRRRHRHEGRACLIRDETSDRDDPARRLIADEVRAEVRSAIGKLGPVHRRALELHMINGLDYQGIAQAMGIPIGTVRSRLARAREALRLHLAPPRS